jgi:excisionase family DNA binding protein
VTDVGPDGDDGAFDEPLLRTSQVAALLRTSDRTVRTWAELGKLHFIKTLGGRRLFPASAVMQVLNEMRGVPREEA